jgi:predicted membrane channel-forming protein YqfA (hemolysin III family)
MSQGLISPWGITVIGVAYFIALFCYKASVSKEEARRTRWIRSAVFIIAAIVFAVLATRHLGK